MINRSYIVSLQAETADMRDYDVSNARDVIAPMSSLETECNLCVVIDVCSMCVVDTSTVKPHKATLKLDIVLPYLVTWNSLCV